MARKRRDDVPDPAIVKASLLTRLSSANPGWSEYAELMSFAESLDFCFEREQYVGDFISSGARLVFCAPDPKVDWPAWMPAYVPALHGMKADHCGMAGGYAWGFKNALAEYGRVFSQNDEELYLPLIEPPNETYYFQTNECGAWFFVSTRLEVSYPNSESRRFEVLDSLENFTKRSIRQTMADKRWFEAYSGAIKGFLVD